MRWMAGDRTGAGLADARTAGQGQGRAYRRVLIVVEDCASSAAAVDEGLALARAHGADVVFARLLPAADTPVIDASAIPASATQQVEQVLRQRSADLAAALMTQARRAGVAASTLALAAADGAHGLAHVAASRSCDVIVVASEGHNAVVRLLAGSVIPGLITCSPVPVLVCRAARSPAAAAARPRRRRRDDPASKPWREPSRAR